MKKKFSAFFAFVMSGLLMMSVLSPVSAAFYSKTQTLNGYSLAGLHVLQINFKTQGHVYTNSGSVTDMYFDYWAWFPNTISNPSTWKAYHPRGQYARGSIDLGAGINSPWGVIGVSTGRKSFSILY